MNLSRLGKHRIFNWNRGTREENPENKYDARQPPRAVKAIFEPKGDPEEVTTSAEVENLWSKARQILAQNENMGPILVEAANIVEQSGLTFDLHGAAGHQQLHSSLNAKVEELKQKEWVVQIDDHYVHVRERLIKAIRNVLVLKDFVSTAAAASPPVAIVCAGMAVSLLLFIRAEDQEESLLEGLEKTSDLIPRLHMMEGLYLHSNSNIPSEFMERFKGGVVSLYCKVLEFQARALCFLQKNALSRMYRNIFHEKWDALRESIVNQENETHSFTRLLDTAERKQDGENISRRFEEALERHRLKENTLGRNNKVEQFIKLLYTCPYRDRKDRIDNRVPQTCEWFTKHPYFQKWNQSEDSSLLWVSADPGCGKSVLSKYLVDEVLATQGRTICYFFFRDDYPDQRTTTIAVASILRQIFLAKPHLISDSVLGQHGKEGEKLVESFLTLWDMLKSITASSDSEEIICVIDALDECQEDGRKQLVESITDFCMRSNNNHRLKFLLTSRPYSWISEEFRELEDQMPTIHLSGDGEVESKEISREIDLVIKKRVDDIAVRKSLDDQERNFLRERLTEIPHRTYLWVALTLDYIQNLGGFTKGKVRETAHSIPETVDEAYEKILNKGKDQTTAKRLLHIILAAQRPLSVEELSLAVALRREGQPHDEIIESIEPAKRFQSTLRNICGLMLVIVDNRVYLLHQTVKEYLVRNPTETVDSVFSTGWKHSLSAIESHQVLAEICTWHICAASEEPRLDVLLEYSAIYWTDHFRKVCSSLHRNMTLLAARLCVPRSKLYDTWVDVYRSRSTNELPTEAKSLHVASWFGLYTVVQELLGNNNTCEVDIEDSESGYTPLLCAARNGYASIVRLLLTTGKVDTECKDSEHNQTPLSWAADNGHDSVVKLLLDTGKVDIESRDSNFGQTPLSVAAEHGHGSVVQLLLDTGKVNIDSKDNNDRTPLSWAAGNGHDKVVRLLLDTGKVDIESKDSRLDLTPLSFAAEYGHDSVVKLLLDTGKVDIESRDFNFGQTPLSVAAKHGHDSVVQLLLDTGKVNIESEDFDGRTPVSWAIKNGYNHIVQLLETRKLETEQI
ncbi:hypothetical protein N7513_002714 [Penicillium frequentans]|nr:hypothetical protein N7513_002714 [Penicillium glabrum]